MYFNKLGLLAKIINLSNIKTNNNYCNVSRYYGYVFEIV